MRSSTDWLRHFEANAQLLLQIPWERRNELTAEEASAIGPSVA